MSSRMTKAALVERLHAEPEWNGRAKLSKKQVAVFVDAVLVEIIDEVVNRSGEVMFVGFGTFRVGIQKARTTRLPDGAMMKVPEKRVVKFRPGYRFKNCLNPRKTSA